MWKFLKNAIFDLKQKSTLKILIKIIYDNCRQPSCRIYLFIQRRQNFKTDVTQGIHSRLDGFSWWAKHLFPGCLLIVHRSPISSAHIRTATFRLYQYHNSLCQYHEYLSWEYWELACSVNTQPHAVHAEDRLYIPRRASNRYF